MGLEDDVDDFIRKADVDSRAAAALRAEDTATQRAVLDRGDMSDCRNPSASLMSRIRVAKENMAASRGRSISPARSSAPPPMYGGAPSVGSGPSQREIDDFIQDNDIDEMASRQLREADGPTQRSVLDRGSLTDCRNPSAVCLARIRDAKQNRAQSMLSQPLVQPGTMYGSYGGYGSPLYAGAYAGAYGVVYGIAAPGCAGTCPGGYPATAYGSNPYGVPPAPTMASVSPMRYAPY
mmetsp:Transcript_106191/g.342567  ORF Transcript_106191/g.342567 Transcript_106191/m.342567 type:complete len:236 (+) Transcript_106191:52-759(+)